MLCRLHALLALLALAALAAASPALPTLLPTVALPANASVTARALYAAEHGAIVVHLCGVQDCSSVRLAGVSDDGTLRYATATQCNLRRGDCSPDKDHLDGGGGFPPGQVVLEVEHRPGELAVWLQGRPDDKVTVPVKADYDTLRVTPANRTSDMPVQFSALPTLPPTVALPANASVTARAQYAAEHGAIEVHLCGGQDCSTVDLAGVGADGTLRYTTATQCDLRGGGCNPDKVIHLEGAGGFRGFPPGQVVLEVEHRPGQLAVWLQGRPDDKVTVPVKADYDTLRVTPFYMTSDMPVQFSGVAA